jgi:hypothetical protein
MAAFPALPLDIQAEFYTAGQWRSIVSDIREGTRINIVRGVTDESTTAVASNCQFQLNNGSGHGAGNYDPGNPTGAYYGSIGRGTPFRCSVRTGQDQFGRTVTGGWGTADTGGAWSTEGAGGTLSPSDYNVAAGVGTHSVPQLGAHRTTYLAATTYFDVDLAVTCSVLPSTNVTGAQVEFANLLFRGQGVTYYCARAAIQPDQSITLGIFYLNAGTGQTWTIVGNTTIAGVTHSGTNQIRVRALIEGQVVRAKLWDIASTEPMDWQVTGEIYGQNPAVPLQDSGYIGIRSGIAPGNTNTLPIVFSYDDVQVRVPRYAGTVADMEVTASDIGGKDQYVAVTVAAPWRRISQSTSTLQSALRRSIPTLPSLVAYWPCEDGATSTVIASGLATGAPMAFSGSPSFASYTGFACSAPILTANTVTIRGLVPIYTDTGNVQVRFLAGFPAAGTFTGQPAIMDIGMTGTIALWRLSYATGGALNIQAYDRSGVQKLNSTIGFTVDGEPMRISIQMSQSGSDISYTLSTLAIGVGNAAAYTTGTVTGQTLGAAQSVTVAATGTLSSTGIGHITVESAVTDIFTLADQLNAFASEDAGTRFVRLCGENGITGDYQADTSVAPALMGSQLANNLAALLQECADADRGILYEPRGATNALSYKALGAHYNQTVTLALTTATHDLGTYPRAVFDDQNTHNIVTVQRPSGSSVTAQQTTGPLGTNTVQTPTQQVTANVYTDGQLNDLTTWIVHLGTVSDPRIPPLTINLLRPGNAALMIPAAQVDVDDRITITGFYPDVTSLLARGYNEVLAGHTWTITFNLAPESPFEIFTLDDTVLGRLDSDASTLHDTTITAAATSFSVDASDGVLWTTAAGDWPVLIRMGGEVMSVGAISGTSSPQTFSSVTRAVNGVSKAHSHGEQITVAQPVYLALGRP